MSQTAYLYVTPFFPSPDNWRGAYSLDYVKALKRVRPELRIEVFVPGDGDDYEIEGINVWQFKERILRGFVFPFLFRKKNENSFLAAVHRSGIDVSDIVVCHGNTARLAIYPLAIKQLNPQCMTLLHHHDLASLGLNLGILHKCLLYNVYLFRKLRDLHEQIDCHVFISEASRRSFLSAPNTDWTVYNDYKTQMHGPKIFNCRAVKIKNSVVLHNGVDTTIFVPRRTQNNSKKFTIGCVGNFEKFKDQITLLKALDILNHKKYLTDKIKIIFVGSGTERLNCETYAKNAKIDVEFRNEVMHKDLPSFYHGLDLFVLPCYFEGFGCVYTEAYSCGIPFMGVYDQGVEELIVPSERDKWLIKPHDHKQLSNIIERQYFENNEQHLCCHYNIDILIKEFVNYLNII